MADNPPAAPSGSAGPLAPPVVPEGGGGAEEVSTSVINTSASTARNRKKKNKKKAKALKKAEAASAAPTEGDGVNSPLSANGDASEARVDGGGSEEESKNQKDMVRGAIQGAQQEELIRLLNRGKREGSNAMHKFWGTQPVPQGAVTEEMPMGPIDEEKTTVEDVRPTPYNMPAGFEWCDVDMRDTAQAEEVYSLLTNNYVEDDDNMFRFDYSVNFLQWALMPPGYRQDHHVGVRNQRNNSLMAFISGVPANIRVRNGERGEEEAAQQVVPMVEINFLCVHKKLRAKRLAPVLIKEITRRVNMQGVFQAVYTAGVVLPKPVASCRYWHRSLEPKKLIDVGFSRLAPRMTMSRTIKLYRLPTEPSTPGIRPMTMDDVPGACRLLANYLENFNLATVFDEADFAHWVLPRDGVVNAYVVQDAETGEITDMCSFYHLPSTIIGNPVHSTLRAAYSFYNVATTVPLEQLMKDVLILAKQEGMDVFNALNIMENDSFLKNLKFGIGDGHLQYYLYNWRCQEMPADKVGLVLL